MVIALFTDRAGNTPFLNRPRSLYCTLLCCALHILRLLQIEGLWPPYIYRCRFSTAVVQFECLCYILVILTILQTSTSKEITVCWLLGCLLTFFSNKIFFKLGAFSSVTQLCPTLCDPMDCSTPSLPVHHQLLELSQTHVQWVDDAIQPSHPLSSPSAFSLSQHQRYIKVCRLFF